MPRFTPPPDPLPRHQFVPLAEHARPGAERDAATLWRLLREMNIPRGILLCSFPSSPPLLPPSPLVTIAFPPPPFHLQSLFCHSGSVIFPAFVFLSSSIHSLPRPLNATQVSFSLIDLSSLAVSYLLLLFTPSHPFPYDAPTFPSIFPTRQQSSHQPGDQYRQISNLQATPGRHSLGCSPPRSSHYTETPVCFAVILADLWPPLVSSSTA